MKKVVSIILLTVFIFNLVGYHLFFWGLMTQADRSLTRQLNNDIYSADETFVVKLPLAIPYAADQNSYQRIDGRFECAGEHYKMVKQRLVRDTLTIVMVKDTTTKGLTVARDHFTKLTHEPISGEKNPPSGLLKWTTDYESQIFQRLIGNNGWCQPIEFCSKSRNLISFFTTEILQPPKIHI